MHKTIPVLLIFCLSACAPSDADYADAVKRNWPNEQAAQRERAAFFTDHAKSFDEGAARSAEISAKLNSDNEVGESAKEAANEARENAADAQWIGNAQITNVTDIRCADATPLPGKNCEMQLELKGADQQVRTLPAAYRFDNVDGKTTIVSSGGN